MSGYRGQIQLHLQGTQHLAPVCLMYPHKDLHEPLPKTIWFIGQYPTSHPSAPGPESLAPAKLCLMAQTWTSGGHLGITDPPAGVQLEGISSYWHHMPHSAHWLPGPPIRESGHLSSEEGGLECLRSSLVWMQCLPHRQSPGSQGPPAPPPPPYTTTDLVGGSQEWN